MKIAIIGAGALGSLFGGLLAKSGEEVWLFDPIATEHIAKIKARGLIIEGEDGEERIKVKGTARVEEVGQAELAALFVKAPHTEEAIKGALPAIGTSTPVLSLQNGLGITEVLKKHVLQERLLRGITSQGATYLSPGRISHAGRGPTRMGLVSADGDETELEKVIQSFNRAGIETYEEGDIERLVWRKLLINVGINALTAIFGVPNGELISDQELRAIMHEAISEALMVARARGLDFQRDQAVQEVEEVCHLTAGNISSMLQDVRRGGLTEIAYINGAIVKEGERRGVKTPLNRLLVRLVDQISGEGGNCR